MIGAMVVIVLAGLVIPIAMILTTIVVDILIVMFVSGRRLGGWFRPVFAGFRHLGFVPRRRIAGA